MAIFEAAVEVPRKAQCGGDNVCVFIGTKLGIRRLFLRGTISSSQVVLKFGIDGNIVLKSTGTRIVLTSAKLILKLGDRTEFGLSSSVDITFKNTNNGRLQTVPVTGK